MIVGFKIIHLSLEHYTTGIFSNVSRSFWHISHSWCTWILNQCALQTQKVADYPMRWTPATGAGIRNISFLPERRLCQSFVHLKRLTWPSSQAISMPGRCISRLVIFEEISAIHRKKRAWILIGLIPCAQKGAKNTDDGWDSAVGTVLSPLWNLDITGRSLKWNSPDGFQRQCFPLLAAWVGDYPEQVIIAQVLYGSCPMCEIPEGTPMGHSTCRALDNSWEQHVHSELLDETSIDVLHTLHVHPIHNQFWQFPLCNVYRLWQPDELHQLLLGLVKDLLHWLLKYLKARNVKDQFDNGFTSVPQYPGLQRFSKPFDSMESSSWQGKEIRGMIRTLSVNCAPILDYSKDDRKTAVETASDEMVMGAVRVFCEFSLLVGQQNHSDLSLTALDNPLKWFYKKKGAFREQTMLKSAKANVDEQLSTESH